MKFTIVNFLGVLALGASTLVPGPTDDTPDPNFTAIVDTTAGSTLQTPNGADILTVSGVGNVLLFDQGTPGDFILASTLDETQAVGLTFDLAAGFIDASGNFDVAAIGAALTPVTDAGLAALLGASSFTFAPASSLFNPLEFDFTSATLAAPASTSEPAGAFLVGIGLFAILAMARWRTHAT